jgi:hypothetical protein
MKLLCECEEVLCTLFLLLVYGVLYLLTMFLDPSEVLHMNGDVLQCGLPRDCKNFCGKFIGASVIKDMVDATELGEKVLNLCVHNT